jgi:hypothetical protein
MNEAPQTNALRTRFLGLFLLLCSAVLSYTSVYTAFEKAWQHANSLSISTKAVVIIPAAAILGLLLLLFPRAQALLWNDGKKLTVYGWIFVVAFIGIGFGFEFWFEQQLRALGYRI